jgi:uncharacterized tellurite resistance protein B-like protein
MPTDTEIPRLLSFLFLAYSTVTDGELSPEELAEIATRLKRWIPEDAAPQLVEFVEQAAALYAAHANDASIWASTADFTRLLRSRITIDERYQVIEDLVHIAEADGIVVPDEIRFIRRVMDIFEIEAPILLREGVVDHPLADSATNLAILKGEALP